MQHWQLGATALLPLLFLCFLFGREYLMLRRESGSEELGKKRHES